MNHDHRPISEQSSDHHDHGSGHDHQHKTAEKGRLGWVIALTGVMMFVETVYGLLSGSLALLSDAGHMLTHFGALLISLVAIYIARRPSLPEKSYGLYRVEILAALLNSAALLVITVFIFKEAIQRLIEPRPIELTEMFVVAVIGLIANLLSAAILWKVGRGEDLNIRSAFLHMLGDTGSSVAIVLGAIIIKFTGALWIDPVLSVLICVVILIWAYNLTRSSILILLEATPHGISLEQVAGTLQSVVGVHAIHDLHIWTITSGMHALTAHIEAPDQPLSEIQKLRSQLEEILRQRFSISHTNLQFEVVHKTGCNCSCH
jgi:cobalt-zinc-cadmium efflux system protein